MLNFGLEDKVVVVTGGASGIGRAITELAADQKCRLAVIDANAEAAAETAKALEARGSHCLALPGDVRDADFAERSITRIEAELGPVHGLVTSAGIGRPAPSVEMTLEGWKEVLDVNLTGSFLFCQAAGRRMMSRRSGAIVAISSISGLGGHANRPNYVATKFGVIGMVKTLAIEWGRFGVRVNAICPGMVDTPLLRANIARDHIEDVMVDRVPMGRLSTGLDQARVCLFLLSEAASYVNGTALPVDGGLTAGYLTHHCGADVGAVRR